MIITYFYLLLGNVGCILYPLLTVGLMSMWFQVEAVNAADESVAEYACQRVTLLHHHNEKFTVCMPLFDI